MAEWWNKNYEFKIWSSLWVFLKEVEEVEEKRARYYLEPLLEKRYDTVDVLALASKQDLVEDANVVPGDALRIIAAAKEVVAQRDVDRAVAWNQVCESYGEDILGVLDFGLSEPSQHESKHGGEVRSEISQMQKTKAGAQETAERSGQGKGILPLPQRKIPQRGSQTAAPTRNGRIYYACGLCQLTCVNEYCLRLHFKGKKHADRMQQGEDDGRRTAVRYAGTATSGELVISPQAYNCSLCNITCSGKKNLVMHFKGTRHQAIMEEISNEEEDEEDLQSVPSKPAFPSAPSFPSKPAFLHQPAFPSQPTGLCTQDWRFQMKSTNRGLANLSMG